jgi:2-desacetyl-2-hydroxyethyl bacteriochlorophyllide A dehydrogenase
VRAALLTAIPTDRFVLADVPDPVPGPHEVLLAVAKCGICGTDLHILDGRSYRPDLPFVLGHEAVGRVIATGSPEDASLIGQRVTMTDFTGDGTCALCLAGDERLCPDLVAILGVRGRWGGFAERLVVPTPQVVPVPDGIPDEVVATLVDAGASAANSVRVAGLPAGSLAVVVGGGPLGVLAAELLRASDVRVIVVQTSEARRTAIAAMGHDVRPGVAAVAETPDGVIDAAGAPQVLPWALGALGPRGVFVAAAYGPVPDIDLSLASRKELTIRGIRSGRREDLMHVIDLVATGTIRVPPVRRWPLDAIDDALAALRARAVPGKAVIDVAA